MKAQHEDISQIINGYALRDDPKKTVLFVFHRTPEYVIYEVKETSEVTYNTSVKFEDNIYEIALELDKVETYLTENPGMWPNYKNTMAQIYSNYLADKPERKACAKKLLKEVASEIRYQMYNKVYYLAPCVIVTLLMGLFAVAFKSYNTMIGPTDHPIDNNLLRFFYMATFGAIGGLLSIAIYVDKHDEKFSRSSSSQRLYAGLIRMLVAMLSGLIVYILFKAEVIGFPSPGKSYFEFGLAIISGFSQNLVPNLASKAAGGLSKEEIDPVKNQMNPAANPQLT